MGSLQDAADQLASYMSGIVSNARAAEACDLAKASIEAAGHGTCSIDVAWVRDSYCTISVAGNLKAEAEIRKILHAAADEVGLDLEEPKRIDNLATYGSISVGYGPVMLMLHPAGSCRRVQVGTRTEPAKEVPIYEIVCDEEAPVEGEAS